MKNRILYILLFILVGLGLGLIIFIKTDCNCDCKCDDPNNTDTEILEESYTKLSNKLIEYLDDIYNNDKYMNGGIEPNTYVVTLGELKDKGYDISMFVNPNTGKLCDLEKTYGKFIILGETEEGKTDFTYSTSFYCEE